jgi:glycosyltransferase involved in cell wall biosynthesis
VTTATPAPRVVIGVPLYNAAEHLPEALESLLNQTCEDLRLLLVDDRSTDETPRIAGEYAALDGRVSYVCNATRLGLTRNWRRAFELGRERFPSAPYYAWGSDHDFWHPRFVESLVRVLDARPEAAMAYPDAAVLRVGRLLELRPPTIDTTDARTLRTRLRLLARDMRAGQMVYGVFRTNALVRAGGFRHVLYADRLLLTEVALGGELVRVPEALWYKRPTGAFSVARQRRACFPDGTPVHARLPWWMVHAALLAWCGAVAARRRPTSRRRMLAASWLYLWNNALVAYGRTRRRMSRRLRRSRVRPKPA